MNSEWTPTICRVCGRPLVGTGPYVYVPWTPELPGALVHARCREWRGSRFPAAAQLDACRDGWRRWAPETRKQAGPLLVELAALAQQWPPADGDAFDALVSEIIRLRLAIVSALRGDPGAKREMKRLTG